MQAQGLLPSLPKLPPLSRESKYSIAETESNINALLRGEACLNPAALVRFFRIMSRDQAWMALNPTAAGKVIRGVSCLYLQSENGNLTRKINQYVLESHANLLRYAPTDMILEIHHERHPEILGCVSLFLACQSSYFHGMLKGGFNEAASLRQYYQNPSLLRPIVQMKGISRTVAKAYVALIVSGERSQLDEKRSRELVQFVDMTDSYKATILKDERIFMQRVTVEIAEKALEAFSSQLRIKTKRLCKQRKIPVDAAALELLIKAQVQNDFMKYVTRENAPIFAQFAHKNGLSALFMRCQTP